LPILLVAASSVPGVVAQSSWDRPLPDPVPYHVDSGELNNGFAAERLAHTEVVHLPGADWMRLYFGAVELAPGSFLRISSLGDGEMQELDREALAMWNGTSAYFNGDSVKVEVIAAPFSVNRMIIDQVAWEDVMTPEVGCDPGCCGPTDDRVPSSETWSNRLMPAGCTASIYNTDSCAVSAGHCAGGSMTLQFNVPPSLPNCSLVFPPVADQFPVTQFQFANGGVGNDWMAMKVGTNNLGQTPFQRYGQFRPIASTPPVVGQPATVWGYGVDDLCTANQTQQTSSGFIEVVGTTSLRYSIDVTFGNSGSGVLRNGQEIVGIVTHCCCPNQGTRVDHPSFVAARENLCPTSAPQAAPLMSASVIVGVPVSGTLASLLNVDASYYTVDSVTAGVRNNAIVEVVAESPASTVNELNVTVVYGPADATPVFYAVQLFNDDTSSWQNMEFGVTSQTGATVVDLINIVNPNAYVSASGLVRVRVTQTARLAQTPSGFTQQIDAVSITVEP
jgi:hypothetical protein